MLEAYMTGAAETAESTQTTENAGSTETARADGAVRREPVRDEQLRVLLAIHGDGGADDPVWSSWADLDDDLLGVGAPRPDGRRDAA